MRRYDPLRRIAPPNAEQPAWRLEHKIPLTLACAVLAQCIGLVIWATHLEARVEAVERAEAGETGLNEKFARLEERIDAVRSDISRLGRQVEKIAESE